MAAAMASQKSSRPSYIDLARARVNIERIIDASACSRLVEAVSPAGTVGDVSLKLQFSFDERVAGEAQPIRVTGSATVACELQCQACDEPVPYEVDAVVDAVMMFGEPQAQAHLQRRPDDHVIVTADSELDEVLLVEDELLLQLPHQVCADMNCARRPSMSYGPQEKSPAQRANPFAALAALKDKTDSPMD